MVLQVHLLFHVSPKMRLEVLSTLEDLVLATWPVAPRRVDVALMALQFRPRREEINVATLVRQRAHVPMSVVSCSKVCGPLRMGGKLLEAARMRAWKQRTGAVLAISLGGRWDGSRDTDRVGRSNMRAQMLPLCKAQFAAWHVALNHSSQPPETSTSSTIQVGTHLIGTLAPSSASLGPSLFLPRNAVLAHH